MTDRSPEPWPVSDVTPEDLAERFGYSSRTIFRSVAADRDRLRELSLDELLEQIELERQKPD